MLMMSVALVFAQLLMEFFPDLSRSLGLKDAAQDAFASKFCGCGCGICWFTFIQTSQSFNTNVSTRYSMPTFGCKESVHLIFSSLGSQNLQDKVVSGRLLVVRVV
ncbi:hypothetical protein QBC35DRAFT_479004 [Podospora australis]|uniref:Uncharacterized protein n=1 Tax=Podospora australis TaxID=1536484 RepID=A0AAN7ADZ6_9PEZI|nr:hypothetical protein QBC35DRAFT_479004 [Podospora australis]